MREELAPLLQDIAPALSIAEEAFGNKPDTINFWFGDSRAVSKVHKDPYENMYCVVRGAKHFTLLPPASGAFMYEAPFQPARYVFQASGTAEVVVQHDEEPVPWIPVDVHSPDLKRHPLMKHAAPVSCTVKPGETLVTTTQQYNRLALISQPMLCLPVPSGTVVP